MSISNQIKSVVLSNCTHFTNPDLIFQNYNNLETIIICSGCLPKIQSFTVSNCDLLQRILIHDNCFTDLQTKGRFSVSSCKQLQSISIGPSSFTYYSICECSSMINID